jgi:hypothetical protein
MERFAGSWPAPGDDYRRFSMTRSEIDATRLRATLRQLGDEAGPATDLDELRLDANRSAPPPSEPPSRRTAAAGVSIAVAVGIVAALFFWPRSAPDLALDQLFGGAYDYEPAGNAVALRDRSEVVTVARVVSIDDGARFGDPPTADDASTFVRFTLASALMEEPIVLELPRPPYVSVDVIRGWVPLDTEFIVYVNRAPPVSEGYQEFWEGRLDDFWRLTTPEGLIVNLPDRGWYQPLAQGPGAGFNGSPDDFTTWLPDGREFVAESVKDLARG